MQWTARLEARTSTGEVKTTELVTLSRSSVIGTLAEIGLMLAETKTLFARQCAKLWDDYAAAAATVLLLAGLKPEWRRRKASSNVSFSSAMWTSRALDLPPVVNRLMRGGKSNALPNTNAWRRRVGFPA